MCCNNARRLVVAFAMPAIGSPFSALTQRRSSSWSECSCEGALVTVVKKHGIRDGAAEWRVADGFHTARWLLVEPFSNFRHLL